MTLAEQEAEKEPVSETVPVPVVSEEDRIGAPLHEDVARTADQPAAPPVLPPLPSDAPSTGDEPTVFMPAAPKRGAAPELIEPTFDAPAASAVPPVSADPPIAIPPVLAERRFDAPPVAAPVPPPLPGTPPSFPQAGTAPAVTPPTARPVAPPAWPPAPARETATVDPADEPTMIISPVLSNRPSQIERTAPAVMPAAPMAQTPAAPIGQTPAAVADQMPASGQPTLPPPLPIVMVPPPPPPPLYPPRLPVGEVGPGGRKPLVARKRLREPPPRPIASEIQPSESARRRRNARSRAARSSVVVVFDGLMSLAAFGAAFAGILAIAFRHEFEQPGLAETALVVEVPAKRSLDDIGDILEKAGVVSDSTIFIWGARFAQLPDLKAGEYGFKPHATMREVAEELQQGKVIQHKITFPEGWTSEQVVQRLLDDTRLSGKIAAIPEEGSLLPETYLYPKGETREHILDQMRRQQDRRLTEIWAHRNADLLKMLKVPKDLVVLASIVEKETGKADERARVAAVFVNRLNRNMRLETDPTILYGLYGGKAWLEPRVLTKADLAAPNPYNTYKINGLPPGPIGNPGRAAMEAVASPAVTNELFFVADGTGGHVFAETLDEHNKNVARWREIEKQRHASDPSAPATPPGGTGIQNAPTPTLATTPTTVKPTAQKPVAQKPRPRVVQPPIDPTSPN